MGRPARSRSRARGSAWRSVLSISESRLAGYCAIALAVTMILTAVTYVLLPGHPTDVNGILKLAGTSPGWFRFLYGVFALGGVFGLAVVAPVTDLAGDTAPQWLAWAKRIAYLAFAVAVVQGVRLAALLPQLGALYFGCFRCPVTLAQQQDVARGVYLAAPLDPLYIVIFGGLALWTLAISAASLRGGGLPRLASLLGIALAAGYLLTIVSLAAGQFTLFALAAVVTGVFLGPIWYIWLGVVLTARPR